ncbi:hypothetical protein FOA52_008906 [Chlamydomonas sp. UWO 241]|nr:hypothetical protein FOA52_008906 [Chlamydomonas sp. UWO 241]
MVTDPIGTAKVLTATILKTYDDANASATLGYDIAFLRLDRPLGRERSVIRQCWSITTSQTFGWRDQLDARSIGRQAGWMGVTAACTPGATQQLTTAGYPLFIGEDSNVCATTQCSVTFDAAGAPTGRDANNTCSKRILSHECDAIQGQSGSPMYNDATLYISALLTGQLTWPPAVNIGTRITPEVLALVCSWMGQDARDPTP